METVKEDINDKVRDKLYIILKEVLEYPTETELKIYEQVCIPLIKSALQSSEQLPVDKEMNDVMEIFHLLLFESIPLGLRGRINTFLKQHTNG